MQVLRIVVIACTLFCINAAHLNLVNNPGFDEAYSSCSSAPSWSQYNATNRYSVCPQLDYYVVSKPDALFLNGLAGWAGAVQTIQISQQVPTHFNFSCMYDCASILHSLTNKRHGLACFV
jgi:hypothetical protein